MGNNDVLYIEREPLYMIINALCDRFRVAEIDLQKSTYEERELMKHRGARVAEFAVLPARYDKAVMELYRFFIDKKFKALREQGINKGEEIVAIILKAEKLRREGVLPSIALDDVYLPDKDLFIKRKIYEGWNLPPDKVDQVMAEWEMLDKTMKHYKEVN